MGQPATNGTHSLSARARRRAQSERQTVRVEVTMSPSLVGRINTASVLFEESLSQYIRRVVLERLVRDGIAATPPAPARRTRR